MAKSTFVTTPSFASSSSVTSINHVPRVPVSSRNTPILAYTRRPIAAHPIFRHRPVPFPFYQLLPSPPLSFFDPLLYTPPASARARARIIPEVHSSGKNEISRAGAIGEPTQHFDYFSQKHRGVFRERAPYKTLILMASR